MCLHTHSVNRCAIGSDVFDDIDEVSLFGRIREVVVVIEDKHGVAAILPRELERLDDPWVSSGFALPQGNGIGGSGTVRSETKHASIVQTPQFLPPKRRSTGHAVLPWQGIHHAKLTEGHSRLRRASRPQGACIGSREFDFYHADIGPKS